MIKALVVDDEQDVRTMVKARLESGFDCWVDLVSNVEGALWQTKKKNYDIMFIDWLMLGERDGFDFLYIVKRKSPKCITVMMSGYLDSFDEMKKKSLGISPDEFMTKPFPEGKINEIMMKYFPDNTVKK